MLEELRNSTKPTITVAEAAKILGCTPQLLRIQARNSPEKLGFPVICPTPHRVLIPRKAFLHYVVGDEL